MEEEIVLPSKRSKAERINPKRIVIYGKYKTGKTTLIAALDNCLILDFEEGSDFTEAMRIKIDSLATLRKVGTKILEAGKPYARIAVDTVTSLEDMCRELAVKLYRATPIGKNFEGDNILTLPNGAGYMWLRQAVESVLSYIDTLADDVILLAQVRDKQIEVKGKEVAAIDIDLTGKLRTIVCSKADAIGYLNRVGDQTLLSFVTKDEIICGARPEHLRNKEIVVAEMIDGVYTTYWDRIYK